MNATHGTVDGDRQFAPNTTVEFTATPEAGYVFSKWTGAATGNNNPLSLLLDADKTVTAIFSRDFHDPDPDGLTKYQELSSFATPTRMSPTRMGTGFRMATR